MRALISIALLLAGTDAVAERMVRARPTIERECRTGRSWHDISVCVARFGSMTLLREGKTAKLVRVEQGTYLYVLKLGQWSLGGRHGSGGELIDFKTITIGDYAGYRIDFADLQPTQVVLDDSSIVPAILATRTSVYCSGVDYGCSEAVTACDLFVAGKAYRTFRGIVAASLTELSVTGDRTMSGTCATPERIPLSWPDA
ncbi:MAG: hypothetical protein JWO36_1783 [Myxococcales bacterium]|nr:hypothetical protein [Myxococcales bacterium]